MAKYEFTGKTKTLSNGATVKQIRRLKDGITGGWIEAERNLSQYGNAWVHGDALVYGDARVSGSAQVYGSARVEKPMDYIHIAGFRFPITIRNDGYASIGCQTKSIQEWLEYEFSEDCEVGNRDEFNRMQALLRPIFMAYLPVTRLG